MVLVVLASNAASIPQLLLMNSHPTPLQLLLAATAISATLSTAQTDHNIDNQEVLYQIEAKVSDDRMGITAVTVMS